MASLDVSGWMTTRRAVSECAPAPISRSEDAMSTNPSFDVIVVGGGIAGSALASVLARAGLGVLVVEREERFRDRIRGEGTWSWGVAAGAPDPTQGHGTSPLFHDVCALSELLHAERDWDAAIDAFAERRSRAFDGVLAYDRWTNMLRDEGPDADLLREGHARAKDSDPSLGGFVFIEARSRGPGRGRSRSPALFRGGHGVAACRRLNRA
jgi:2-polyprenyl-6-methoxyphenol hydroxylase-like FAD-dependent oxidoreductase